MEMTTNLQFPEENVPLYTAEDYRRDTAGGTRTDRAFLLKQAQERGQGFGFAYMDAVEQATLISGPDWLEYESSRKRGYSNETCRRLNNALEITYAEAAKRMQQYIADHDGVIDCWPDSRSACSFTFTNINRDGQKMGVTEVEIDYFAPSVEENWEDGRGTLYRRAGREFRNCTPPVEVPQMTEMEKRVRELENVKTYPKGARFKNNFKHFLSWQPMILAAVVIVLLGLARFARLDLAALSGSMAALAESGDVVAWLMIIPSFLMLLVLLIEKWTVLSVSAFWIGIAVLAGIGFMGYRGLKDVLDPSDDWISRKAVRAGRRAQESLSELRRSGDYERFALAAAAVRANQRVQSEIWHRAWFNRLEREN